MSDRISIYPSRLALQNMKQRLLASQKGASLLKKRADALSIHYRSTATKALHNILDLSLCMKKARMGMAAVQFVTGNLTQQILESVPTQTKTSYTAKFDNVAGVRLLILQPYVNEGYKNANKMVGLGRGAERFKEAKKAFEQALKLIVEQAGVRYAMKAIDNMFDTTNRRVNGIENVVVPRLERTVHYIISELDEEEREEYFRRKKVQFQKRRKEAQRLLLQVKTNVTTDEKTTVDTKKSRRNSKAGRKFTITSIPIPIYSAVNTQKPSLAAKPPNSISATSTKDSKMVQEAPANKPQNPDSELEPEKTNQAGHKDEKTKSATVSATSTSAKKDADTTELVRYS